MGMPVKIDNDLFNLTGKKAVVTGAGRGIGKDIALGLARAGADLGLVARSLSELDQVAQQIRNLNRRTVVFAADLTVTSDILGLVENLNRDLNGIDILVNNAGTNIAQSSTEVTEAAWDTVIGINLKAAFFMAQAVGNLMIDQGRGGRIINVSSQTGTVAVIKRAAYCASKAGLNLVTKVLAMEWGPHEILVNAVTPTFIETEMTREMLADPQLREYALSKNVLKRFGSGDDVAGAVIYLASPAANLVTGHVLMVDGGWTAH